MHPSLGLMLSGWILGWSEPVSEPRAAKSSTSEFWNTTVSARPALRYGVDYNRYVAAVNATESMRCFGAFFGGCSTNPLAQYVTHELKLGFGFDFEPGRRRFDPVGGSDIYFRFRGGPSVLFFTSNAQTVQNLTRDFGKEVPVEGQISAGSGIFTDPEYLAEHYDLKRRQISGTGIGAFVSLDACVGRRDKIAGCIQIEIAGYGIRPLKAGGVKFGIAAGLHASVSRGNYLTTFKFMLNLAALTLPEYYPYPDVWKTQATGFFQYGLGFGVDLGRATRR